MPAILVKVHFRNELESNMISDKNLFEAIGKALGQAEYKTAISAKDDIVVNRTLEGDNKPMSIEITFDIQNTPLTQGSTDDIRKSFHESFPKFLKKEFVFFYKTAY
jgi:hypothetical protein